MALTIKQKEAAQLCGDVLNTLSLEEIAGVLGITRKTLYAWRQKQEFILEQGKSTEATRSLIRGPAYQCIMKGILAGDVSAARTALQATGDIGSGVQVHTNIYQSEKELANRIDKAWGKDSLSPRATVTENRN